MRIALLTDWYLPRVGGIEVHVHGLARRLRDRGHDARVLTPWPGPDEVEGVPVVRLPLGLVPGLGVSLSPFALGRVVRAALARGRYDVLHGHVSFGSTAAVAGGWAALRVGIPSVGTYHSVLRGLGWVYVAAQPVLRWRSWPFRATAVSEAVAVDVRRIMPEREVSLLPNAIDPEAWTGPPADLDPAHLRLVTVSRLQRRKRVDALLRVVAGVRGAVGGTVDVTLEVLGDGPSRKALERALGRLGLGDAVRLHGAGGPDDVRRLLRGGHVFVNTADREAFGIAALEASSCGLPVVARREGGVGSFIDDGRNGVLVSSDDEMVRALVGLATDPDRHAALRAGAAQGIPTAYTWDAVLDRHLELYREVMEA
ncbi:MAG: glycosyl transferase [Gemmatimonadota bacterium]